MARDESLAAVLRRERVPGVELDAERSGVRPQQGDRLGELVARMAPAELRIRNVALVAIGITEVVFARLGQPVELVVRQFLRHPVAGVLGEVELLERRVPVHADDLAHPARHHLDAAAVEVDTADLRVRLRRHADVARRADVEIQLVVGSDGQILPAVRLVLRQIAVDDGGLRRVVEVVLDLVDLRDLRQLGDVECAVMQRDAVRTIEVLGDDLDLAFAALVDNRVELVQGPVADKHGALVAQAQRARVRDAAGVDFDLEPLRHLQLVDRHFVGRGRERRRRDRGQFDVGARAPLGPRRRRFVGGLLCQDRPSGDQRADACGEHQSDRG